MHELSACWIYGANLALILRFQLYPHAVFLGCLFSSRSAPLLHSLRPLIPRVTGGRLQYVQKGECELYPVMGLHNCVLITAQTVEIF